MRSTKPNEVDRLLRHRGEDALCESPPGDRVSPLIGGRPDLDEERRRREFCRAVVGHLVGDPVAFRGPGGEVPEDGMHPCRGCRRKRSRLPAEIGGTVVAGHVHGQGRNRPLARVPGYEYDQVGLDLLVDPVLVDQAPVDLVERQHMVIGKRPSPAGRKQLFEVLADVHPRNILD